jgi:hypothetical protein
MRDLIIYEALLVREFTGSTLRLEWSMEFDSETFSLLDEQDFIDSQMRQYPDWAIGMMAIQVVPQ